MTTARSILAQGDKPLLLDGGLGTTLENERGKNIDSALWSSVLLATDPASIEEVHLAFLEAGADVILTGTYQSWLEGFESLGHSPTDSKALMLSSIDLVNSARTTFSLRHPTASPRLVGLALGSFGATIAYQGSEYTGKFPPGTADEAFLTEFHSARLELFAEKKDGVDFVAFETVPLPVEVRAIRKAVGRTWVREKPFWIGLTAPREVWPGGRLEDAGESFWGGEDPEPFAIGLNCTESTNLDALVPQLPRRKSSDATPSVLVLYPNANLTFDHARAHWDFVPESEKLSNEEWATRLVATASKAKELGWSKVLIGGCCGTGINAIAALRQAVDKL